MLCSNLRFAGAQIKHAPEIEVFKCWSECYCYEFLPLPFDPNYLGGPVFAKM